jgi:nucleotide-binding universal stress UspA family protein
MIETILIPTSGTPTDSAVFKTALAVAKPLRAHMQFYHVRFSTIEAMVHTPHFDFCLGDAAAASAFSYLRQHDESLSAQATEHFHTFCKTYGITALDTPSPSRPMSASYLQERDRPEARLLAHARHSDLIILGRRQTTDLMPQNLIESLLMASGRPLIIAPETTSIAALKTVVVGWQETPEAARSLGAAIPLLKHADTVILVGVSAYAKEAASALEQVVEQLAWHDITAKTHIIVGDPKEARAHLSREIAERHADMLVVGGYQRGPWREALFGGVTESIIDHAKCPVFLMH